MKHLFTILIAGSIAAVSCSKIKTAAELPDLLSQQMIDSVASAKIWIEQVAKEKADSMRIADSISNAGGAIDESDLRFKKDLLIGYMEVNNRAFKNVACYVDEDGKPVIDLAMVFAPNINMNLATGKPRITYNKQVQSTFDKGYTRYVQGKGIKVGMTLLGNHDNAGFRNFRDLEEARDFAQHVAVEVRRLGIDAIDFDDEWSAIPSWANNQSFVMVVGEVKRLLPDKLVMCYIYGGAASSSYDGKRMGDVADVGSSAFYPQIPANGAAGFPTNKLIASASYTYGGFANAEQTCRDLRSQGYRGVMIFDVRGVSAFEGFLRPYVLGMKEKNLQVVPGCLDAAEDDDVNVR